MAFELYLAFMAASALLILMPGPNVALIVANSFAHGQRYALMTVAGTSSAMVIQLGLVIAGMTTMMAEMAHLFTVFKWVGVAYLLYIGVQTWRKPPADLSVTADRAAKSYSRVFAQGFLISLTNPKTLIFYAAFFPQFMNAALPALPQFLLLGTTFVVMAIIIRQPLCDAGGTHPPVAATRQDQRPAEPHYRRTFDAVCRRGGADTPQLIKKVKSAGTFLKQISWRE